MNRAAAKLTPIPLAENPVFLRRVYHVTDLHATVLHLLGLDNRRLEVPGRKRLEIDHGHVIREILA